jgi:hypothetical protein
MNEMVISPKWARLPLRWIHDGDLTKFRGGSQLGNSVAALKILLAVLLRAENKSPDNVVATQGSASLSYDDLMEMSGLSRSMIASGIKRLRELGRLSVSREGRGGKNRYFVAEYTKGAWGRIPFRAVVGQGDGKRARLLHEMSCKRSSDLNALKLYLLLCAHRNRGSPYAMIGYDRIHYATGILRPRIRQAISILIEHGLVMVDHDKAPTEVRNTPNSYYILGL